MSDGIVKFSPTGQESVFASLANVPNLAGIASDPHNANYLYISSNNNAYHLPTSYVDGNPLPTPIYSGVSFTSISPMRTAISFLSQTAKNMLMRSMPPNAATTLATFNKQDSPVGIVVDANGNYFVEGVNAIYENPSAPC